MSRRAHRPLIVAALLLAGVTAGAGCGIKTENSGNPSTTSTNTKGRSTTEQIVPRTPPRPRGLVQVEGTQQSALTPLEVARFQAAGARATYTPSGEDRAFADLCAGRIDVVESVRQVTRAELAACRRRGIILSPKIQIASDAVVVATRNESDVGGDCVTVGDVKEIFRNGSTISNWSQLGFDNLALKTTGPTPDSSVFQFFTQRVFNLPSSNSLSAFRNDYQARTRSDASRELVINQAGLVGERKAARQRIQAALKADQRDRKRAIDLAVADAQRRALARIKAVNDRNRRLKINVNGPALVASNARFVARLKAQAVARVNRTFNRRALTRANSQNSLALLRAEKSPYVGYFRFTYYENFEDQLRPLEIDPTTTSAANTTATSGTATTSAQGFSGAPSSSSQAQSTQARRPNCIFPSQTTITNQQYPLSRAILLYVGQVNSKRAELQAFLRSYLQNAQAVATANRLVAIPDQQRDEQIAAITGQPTRTTGTGTGGPASAAPGNSGVPGVASSAPGASG